MEDGSCSAIQPACATEAEFFLKNRTSWDVEDWKALASDMFLRCPKEFGGEGNWVLHYLCVRNSVMGMV